MSSKRGDDRKSGFRVEKLTEDEMQRHKKYERLLDEVTKSGEWWRFWLDDKWWLEFLGATDYSKQDVIVAIEELKKLFDKEWFMRTYSSNPLRVKHPFTEFFSCKSISTFCFFTSLGECLNIIGGIDVLTKEQINELRHPKPINQFYSRGLEVIISAYFKRRGFEIDIQPKGLNADLRVKLNNKWRYFEITNLWLGKNEKNQRDRISQLHDVLPKNGAWRYEITMGSYQTLEELLNAIEKIRGIFSRSKPPFEDKKDDLVVKVERISRPDSIKGVSISGTISGGVPPLLFEFYRIMCRVVDKCVQLPSDEGGFLVVKPSMPFFLRRDELRRVMNDLFKLAHDKENKVERITGLIIAQRTDDWENYKKGPKMMLFENPYSKIKDLELLKLDIIRFENL